MWALGVSGLDDDDDDDDDALVDGVLDTTTL